MTNRTRQGCINEADYPRFLHYKGPKGYLCYCTVCYLSVGLEPIEADLKKLEAKHRCEGFNTTKSVHPEMHQGTILPIRKVCDDKMQ